MSTSILHVRVPSGARLASPTLENIWWHRWGLFIEGSRHQVGMDLAFSLLLSRVSHELRRQYGIDGAKEAFQGMIDTMDEAATHDRAAEMKGPDDGKT